MASLTHQKPDRDTLGGRLLRARDAAGLTLVELAKSAGVQKATLEAWELDRSEPRSNKLAMLSGVLGVSPTWLLHGVGASPQTESISDEVRVLKGQIERLEELHEQTTIALQTVRATLNNIVIRDGE